MQRDSPRLWAQFRRLLLGTAVEVFRDAGLRVDTHALELRFHEDSLFRYPAINSEMRFVGSVDALLLEAPSEQAIRELEAQLFGVWPEIVELVRLPMVGAMEVRSNVLEITVETPRLVVDFDLSAG